MPSLRRILYSTAQWLWKDTVHIAGEFTGANGSLSGNKFKGVCVVARTGEGVYTLTLLQQDGTTALKGFNIKMLSFVYVAPAAADGGSGQTEITTDALSASGVITFTTRNLAGTAADIIGLCKVKLECSTEANAA